MSVRVPVTSKGAVVAYAIVDDEDADRVLARKWSLNSRGRPHGPNGRSLHRFVLGMERGTPGEVHHKNSDVFDNRKGNLEVYASHAAHLRQHRDEFKRQARRLFRGLAQIARYELRERHDVRRYGRGCRCEICRAAWSARCRDYRAVRSIRGPRPDQHGLYTTYGNYGCRCDACSAAHAARMRQRKAAA